jgi:hypothetical protein
MSLAHAAEHLKKHGRGPDDQLVHMSKRELKGLQELAMAHGGSLTINPHTGLPEAGFLDSLLPTIIGVGLSVASGGALTPLMAAGITGAGYGLATGDLNKGLMAGLGAYGGAGLGAGLTSAGSAAAQATADTATSTLANQAGQAAGQEAMNLGAQQGLDTAGQEAFKRVAIDEAGSAVPRALAAAPAPTNIGGNLTQAGEGFKSLGGTQGRSAFMSGMADKAPYATPALGFSAVSAAAPEQKMPGAPEPDQYDRRLAGYKLASDYKAYEAPRPNPYYSAQYQNYAEGGITGVPPQTNFANPSQSMMGTSQYDMPVDQMSGNIANRMAEGGVTGSGQMQLNVPLSIGNGETAGGGNGGPTGFGGSGSPYSSAGSGNTPPAGGGGLFNNIQRGLGGKGNMTGPQVGQPPQPQIGQSLNGMSDILKGQPQPQIQVKPLQQNIREVSPAYGSMGIPSAQNQALIGAMPEPPPGMPAQQFQEPQVGHFGMLGPLQQTRLQDEGMLGMQAEQQQQMQRGLGGKGGMTNPQIAPMNNMGDGRQVSPMYDSTNSTSMADFNRGDPYAGTPMSERMSSLFSLGNSNPYVSAPSGPNDRQYASGGIASYRKGGHLSASAGIPDTGIYSDSDLTTRGEQALGASKAKLAQLYKRAGLKSVAESKSGIEKLGGGFSETAAGGGLSHLGGYSDGGRMLKGPGDGMSDDIPAMIGKKQPARLADGEFVVPADVVSHLGNGSTDAGAKKLYGMMNKIRKARTGRKAQGKQINPNKFLPS